MNPLVGSGANDVLPERKIGFGFGVGTPEAWRGMVDAAGGRCERAIKLSQGREVERLTGRGRLDREGSLGVTRGIRIDKGAVKGGPGVWSREIFDESMKGTSGLQL